MRPDDVIALIDEPAYVADIDGFIAHWIRDHQDLLRLRGSLEDPGDKRDSVKRIWEILSDPNRPWDHISVNSRVRMIGYLERLFRTQIRSRDQLKSLVERFLGGLDGRRLPIPQALKRARKRAKSSQRQLAERLGLKDHSLISKIEAGKKDPTKRILDWLKEAENVTRKGQVKGNSHPPAFLVTSSRGKTLPISPNFDKSETLPETPKCTNADPAAISGGDPAKGNETQGSDLSAEGEAATKQPAPEAEVKTSAHAKKVPHV